MSDVSAALERHHQAATDFLAAARAIPLARWSQPRAPGKWSPGQVVEHVTLAYEVSREILQGHVRGVVILRLLRPLVRRLVFQPVLRRGAFFPRSSSPPAFRPSVSPAEPGPAIDRLAATLAAFEADAASLASSQLDHPAFGRIAVADFVRLQEIHARHHRGQLTPAG